MKHPILFVLLLNFCNAQTFLNGSFENHTSGPQDEINTTSAFFNSVMNDVYVFGYSPNIDIITSSDWGGGGAQHCNWYIAITSGGSDALTLKLSSPLLKGNTYTLSYWERKDPVATAYPLQIGLSTVNNSIGTTIHTSTNTAIDYIWTPRTFTFVAPQNGSFISVVQTGPFSPGGWVHIDNFSLNDPTHGSVKIISGSDTLCAGDSISLTALGATNYTWNSSTGMVPSTQSVITVAPGITSTYYVLGQTGNCQISGSITVHVVQPGNVSVIKNHTICEGNNLQLSASGAKTYFWLPPGIYGTSVTVSPMVTTVYTVNAIDNSGCKIGNTTKVSVFPAFSLSIVPSPSLICEKDSYVLTAIGSKSYSWSTAALNSNTIQVPSDITGTFTYTVTGENTVGCKANQSISIEVRTCTNYKEFHQDYILVSPNPAREHFEVSSEIDLELTIYNSKGIAVKYITIWGGAQKVEINLPRPDMYIIRDSAHGIFKKILVLE